MSGIPVRNYYVMLAFAGRDAGLLSDRAIGECDFDRPLDLLARLLEASLARLRNRGLERQYVTLQEAGATPRGTLSLDRTIAELMPPRGHVAWSADDLLPDTPVNRVVRATLAVLMREPTVTNRIRRSMRRHLEWFEGVAAIPATDALRSNPRAPRQQKAYGPILQLCRLALSRALPDAGDAGVSWRDLSVVPERRGELFEAFVRGYAAYSLGDTARVSARQFKWACEPEPGSTTDLLPIMKSDVCIERAGVEPRIIECKFYETPVATSYFGEKGRLPAGHLYQLVAYLRAGERVWEEKPEGTLLYGEVEARIDERWTLDGYSVAVCSLNLARRWEEVESRLRTVLML